LAVGKKRKYSKLSIKELLLRRKSTEEIEKKFPSKPRLSQFT